MKNNKSIEIKGRPAAAAIFTTGALLVIGGITVVRSGLKLLK